MHSKASVHRRTLVADSAGSYKKLPFFRSQYGNFETAAKNVLDVAADISISSLLRLSLLHLGSKASETRFPSEAG
jgi:hypothetical protein